MATSDPLVGWLDARGATRAVLVLGILSGLAVPVYFFVLATETPLAWDFIAYFAAAEAFVAGDPFIGLTPPFGDGQYVYPPVAVLGFVPLLVLGDWFLAYLVHSAVNLVALGGLAVLCVRELDRLGIRLDRIDRVLIPGFCLVSLYPMVTLGLGQIDPIVAVLVAVVFLHVERQRDDVAGIALGVAAVVKIFPAAFGIWLVRSRRWRAAAISVGSGAILGIASVVIFGVDVHREYLRLLTAERSRLTAFAEGLSPDFFDVTLARPLTAMLPGLPSMIYVVLAVAIVGPPLAVTYRRLDTRIDRHLAYLATIIAVIIASPASNLNHLLYLYFPLVVSIYAIDQSRAKGLILVGGVLVLLPVQPEQLVDVLNAAGFGVEAVGPLEAVVRRVFTHVGLPLIGSLLVLGGCAWASINDRRISAVR